MEAASVTGEDLRRVLEPREVQVLVMSMRNGDGEHARRHTAQVLRLGVDEVDELIASARRKVEQVRLRKQARLDVVRPVEEALMDAAQHGGDGRAAAGARAPVGLRTSPVAPAPRLERDDEEARVLTGAERWLAVTDRAVEIIRERGEVEQRELIAELGINASQFYAGVRQRLRRTPGVETAPRRARQLIRWQCPETLAESPAAVGGASPAASSAADPPAGEVGSDAGSGQDGDGPPTAGDDTPPDSSAGPDPDQPLGEVREWEAFPGGRPMTPEELAACGPLPAAREIEETSADPVGTGDAESAGAVSAAASAHEPFPPPEGAGGDSAGGESDGGSLPSRNGGDAPEVVAIDPDEGSSADGCPSSETPPARLGGPPPFAGGYDEFRAQIDAAATFMRRRRGVAGRDPREVARYVPPERPPRERYIDALLSKVDDPEFDATDLFDRIERQLDALG